MSGLLDGNAAIVGLQWGDEGKGKIVDVVAAEADVVVRYCGGANAGHTVRIGDRKYSTHLLPVGVFRPGVMNVVGNGVVLDPAALLGEIDDMVGQGVAVSPANLRVSYQAHVVMPWHQAEDAAREAAAGDGGIGTTKRGIGPCYADKMHRTTAVRVADLTGDAGRLRGADHPHRGRPEHGLRGPVRGPAAGRGGDRRAVRGAGAAARAVRGRHEPPADRGDPGRQAGRVRGGARGHAGRGPRDLPVRDQQQLLGAGAVHRGGRAADGGGGTWSA